MKRVYLAGAYSAGDVISVLKNIGRGEHYAAKLFMAGFAPFCPWHDKSYVMSNWDKDFSIPLFYNYSLAWLEVSDYLVVLSGYEESKGTLKEIKVAKKLGIPIYYNVDKFIKEFGGK